MTHYNETKEIRQKAHAARKALWALIKQIHEDVGPTGVGLKCNDTLLWLKILEDGLDVDDGDEDAIWPPEEEEQ